MQRRTLLGLGLAGTAALGLAGGAAWLLALPAAWREGRLQPPGRRVMHAVARAVLDGVLPGEVAAQSMVLEAHLDRLSAAVAAFPPAAQAEIDKLLTLLSTAPGRLGLAGLADDWSEASVAALHDALQMMRASRLVLRRQAYHALRDLTHAAHYAEPAAWPLMGYPGPRPLP
jgi:hypothetical protein